MIMARLLFCLVVTLTVACGKATAKTAHVRGKVFCPSDPSKAANIDVKLADKDGFLNPDDNMAKNKTSDSGEFYIWGKATDWIGSIEPHLKIYHRCNAGLNPCWRRLNLLVPDMYVMSDGDASNPMDIGTINLEIIPFKEERVCIHFGKK